VASLKRESAAHRGDGGDAPKIDQLGGPVVHANSGNTQARQRLELFGARCREMAERVRAGTVPFIWAIDCLYDAAAWSGLADDVGDDAVQRIMADAFMGLRRA
jgi:hypothetical protein